jgi:hypothetical protein
LKYFIWLRASIFDPAESGGVSILGDGVGSIEAKDPPRRTLPTVFVSPVSRWTFLKNVFGKDADALKDSPAFKKFLGLAYYGVGTASSIAQAVQAFSGPNSNDVVGWLTIGQAVGNLGNAIKPLVELSPLELSEGAGAALEDIAGISSGIGLLATFASLATNSARALANMTPASLKTSNSRRMSGPQSRAGRFSGKPAVRKVRTPYFDPARFR